MKPKSRGASEGEQSHLFPPAPWRKRWTASWGFRKHWGAYRAGQWHCEGCGGAWSSFLTLMKAPPCPTWATRSDVWWGRFAGKAALPGPG